MNIVMKRLLANTLFLFLFLNGTCYASNKSSFIVPPFENFSPYKSRTDYEVTFNDIYDPTTLIRKRFSIDQYSETARSFLESNLVNMGIKVIERMRVDQILSESDLTRKQGFVNEQSALEMGKQIGADTLIMGSILGFQFKNEYVRAYGINQKFKITTCTMRIRIIDIESGNIYFSKTFTGKHSVVSSKSVQVDVSDEAFAAIKNSIEEFVTNDTEFIEIVNN